MAKSQTKTAPKPTMAESLTRSSLFWASVLLFIAVPFINNFFLYEKMMPVSDYVMPLILVAAITVIDIPLSLLLQNLCNRLKLENFGKKKD